MLPGTCFFSGVQQSRQVLSGGILSDVAGIAAFVALPVRFTIRCHAEMTGNHSSVPELGNLGGK